MSDVFVVGHICLDVIPQLDRPPRFDPGNLYEVGPATFAPGGGVANVGLALDRLGVAATMIGQVGDDEYGAILLDAMSARSVAGSASLHVSKRAATSYSIVLSHPEGDRIFLHHPGCNATFDPASVDLPDHEARFLYFGYPALMAATYSDGGTALAGLLREARARGMSTILDMAMPDPEGPSGRVDWPAFLALVLPEVDLFVPSAQEAGFLLDGRFPTTPAAPSPPSTTERATARRLLELGSSAVALTLGDRGMLLVTGADAGHRLGGGGAWTSREIWSPPFTVRVVGTTGAGDAAAAGMIAALHHRLEPVRAVTVATAVAACAVEAPDAVSGVRTWSETLERIGSGWTRTIEPKPLGMWSAEADVYLGSDDRGQGP